MKRRTWSEEDLITSVAASRSIAGVLRALGLRPVGGNYATIKRYVKDLDLDTSHWTGQGWLKGRTHKSYHRHSLEDILVESSPYTSTDHLKKRLIKEGLLHTKCYRCNITTWLDAPLSLHLDHINGVRDDHRLSNLRLLCPNCHSQTETYCGRNNHYSKER